MSVERWRMTSGRVASIDLSGHPDAVQGARELLRMNGAVPINEEGPAAGKSDEAENTSTTEKGNAMSETIEPDAREMLRPIYSTTDPRWGELVEWLRENADRITDDEGRLQASMDGENEALTPSERGWWHARYVLGVPREELVQMDFDWPTIPDDTGEAPSWFKGFGPENGGLGGDDECPRLVWDMVLYDDETTRVDMWREDTYQPDSGEVLAGVDELKVWIDGEPVELSGELSTTAGLLRIVEGLTAALRVAVTL